MRLLNTRTLMCLWAIAAVSCKKESKPADDKKVDPPVDPVTQVVPVDDPETAKTIGFFADEWSTRQFTAPDYAEASIPTQAAGTVTIDASSVITRIPRTIFGHNAVWWMGPLPAQAVTDVKNLNAGIIRFPGGNSANNYFWNEEEGHLPDDVPNTAVNENGVTQPASYLYGKTNLNWQFNLNNYYELLQSTNSKGIISVNYSYARYSTSATPLANAAHLAAQWIRFDNGRTKYWEIGNEHYGSWQAGYRINKAANKDGQPEIITGELYGNHANVFIDSMRKAAADINKTIHIGVVLYEAAATESWQTQTTKTWNAGVLNASKNKADFYVIHNYYTSSGNENAMAILNSASTVTTEMAHFMGQEFQKYGATPKPIALDEWNIFASGSKQQVSNVSGLFAVIVQAEAIKNQYGMAARWDLVNGWDNGNDHGLFSGGDEPGIPKWNLRPSFYYMYYFQKLLGDRMIPSAVTGTTAVKSYATTYSSGEANVSLVNTSSTAQNVLLKFNNFNPGSRFYWYSLEGGNDNGEFSRKVTVNGSGTALEAGGPAGYSSIKARSAATANGIRVTVPARGAVFVVVNKK